MAISTFYVFFIEGMLMKGSLFGALAVLAFFSCSAVGAPEPAIVPGPLGWTVDVRFEHPQQILVPGGVNGKPQRYWYTIVTLTNRTGLDVDFFPRCELMTDTFEIVPAGRGVSKGVFERIKSRHQSKYRFLERLEDAGNRILEGDDNTKDIAIIWSDFGTQARKMKVFIAGLSNETAMIDHPLKRDAAGKPAKVFLRKTLELSYFLSGDQSLRSYSRVSYKGKRWVMR